MSRIKEATIDGFNEFLQEQDMEDDDTFVTLHQFNNNVETVYEDRPVEDAAELDDDNFEPRGGTAYYDALRHAIEEAPDDDTLFFVVTDGKENASEETTQSDVQEFVEQAQDEGHEFIIMDGSGRDTDVAASEIGVREEQTITYDSSQGGTTRAAYMSSSDVSKSLRSGEDASFNEQDREKAS